MTGICLEIEDVFKFDSLEACNGKQAKNNKTSNFQVQENKLCTFKGLQINFWSILISIENSYLIEKKIMNKNGRFRTQDWFLTFDE